MSRYMPVANGGLPVNQRVACQLTLVTFVFDLEKTR
jgi:hypothetical protein